MARFTRYESTNYYYKNKQMYIVEGPLTAEDIDKINSLGQPIILMVKNTKGIDKDLIKRLNSDVSFSVLGGVDYTRKRKFNDSDYIDRTIYSPVELSKIIEVFEKIERGINYSWSDAEKTMYVYLKLIQLLHYSQKGEKVWENGKDVIRSLTGLLYGRAVCSGIALIFKEAMDRIDIPCAYQNMMSHHSWNIVKLDGCCRGMDLTFDISAKGKNNREVYIRHFGQDEDFYGCKHHDLSNEPEEREYPLVKFDKEQINKLFATVTLTKDRDMRCSDGIYSLSYAGGNVHFVYMDGNLSIIRTPENGQALLTRENIRHALKYNDGHIGCQKSDDETTTVKYVRNDGTSFIIRKGKEINDGTGVNEYICYRIRMKNGVPVIRRDSLLSETDLTREYDDRTKSIIANYMLSEERLERKVKHFNGYVGYLGKDGSLYYSDRFERNNLNIMSHIK